MINNTVLPAYRTTSDPGTFNVGAGLTAVSATFCCKDPQELHYATSYGPLVAGDTILQVVGPRVNGIILLPSKPAVLTLQCRVKNPDWSDTANNFSLYSAPLAASGTFSIPEALTGKVDAAVWAPTGYWRIHFQDGGVGQVGMRLVVTGGGW